MLLSPSAHVPIEPAYVHEPKLDGFRAIVSISQGRVRVRSRHGKDWTTAFPELDKLAAVGDGMLDGELVVLSSHGRPDFSLLQTRLSAGGTSARLHAGRLPATYYAFDLVQLGQRDLCPQAWTDRRAALEDLDLPGRTHGTCRLVAYTTDGAAMHRLTAELGFEGTCSKKAASPYLPGRRMPRTWLKTKHHRCQWFQVLGWRPATASNWGGLVVGEHDEPVAVATLALPAGERATLLRLMRRYGRGHPTGMLTVPPDAIEAQVEYLERTVTGKLREPVARAVRPVAPS